ncbi:MAG TPA: hypothetical protein PKK80_04435, partial [Bacilli bacterium]|nr:hypothetical protein [Bacilli bacterium]
VYITVYKRGEKMEKGKRKINLTKKQITSLIVAAVFIVIFVISIFAVKIFGNTEFALFLDENIGQVANIFKLIGNNIGAIFMSVTYIVLAV